MNNFINPRLKIDNIDNYHLRCAISNSIKYHLRSFSGVLLDVGCGQKPYKNIFDSPTSVVSKYVSLDLDGDGYYDSKPDICWNENRIPLDNDCVDSVLCTEVLEHCVDPKNVLMEIYRVMRPQGFVLLTVPFVWPLHDVPNDYYRYTPFAINDLFCRCGFRNIEIKAMGGWDASLAQMLGLWARRRPMNSAARIILSIMMMPLVYCLIARDQNKPVFFSESCMMTGLTVTARK